MSDQVSEVLHTFSQAPGKVRVSVERNSRGVTFSVDVDRPRQDGETFDDCSAQAVSLARSTYDRLEREFPQPTKES